MSRDLEELKKIMDTIKDKREFCRRTGLNYKDLVYGLDEQKKTHAVRRALRFFSIKESNQST